jgi:hypothetical protein
MLVRVPGEGVREIPDASDMIREAEADRPAGCTCRYGVRNHGTYGECGEVEVFSSQGCPLHCSHRGILPGGRCWCGDIA